MMLNKRVIEQICFKIKVLHLWYKVSIILYANNRTSFNGNRMAKTKFNAVRNEQFSRYFHFKCQ